MPRIDVIRVYCRGSRCRPGKLSTLPLQIPFTSATYVCVPGANQYASASSREMFGSNAYVSPAATTSGKCSKSRRDQRRWPGEFSLLLTKL